jgi:hypothetical protein
MNVVMDPLNAQFNKYTHNYLRFIAIVCVHVIDYNSPAKKYSDRATTIFILISFSSRFINYGNKFKAFLFWIEKQFKLFDYFDDDWRHLYSLSARTHT